MGVLVSWAKMYQNGKYSLPFYTSSVFSFWPAPRHPLLQPRWLPSASDEPSRAPRCSTKRTWSEQDKISAGWVHALPPPPLHVAPSSPRCPELTQLQKPWLLCCSPATLATRLPHKRDLSLSAEKALAQIAGSLTHFGAQSVRSSQIILYKTPLRPQYALLPS